MNSLVFESNTAPYGVNIASYAIKIVEVNSLSSLIVYQNVPSGVKLESTLKLELIDYDNQKVTDDSNSIKINSLTQGALVSGFNSAKFKSGMAEFDNLIFIQSPGAQHVYFKATSNAIDATKNYAQGLPSYTTIDVSFRFCMPGEAQLATGVCQA